MAMFLGFGRGELTRLIVGVALVAFAVGGFVVWCLMHFGGAR